MAAVTTANRKDCRGYYDNIRRLLNPQPFANFILGLIIINSIMMGIATFPFVKDDDDLSYKFDLVDQIFLIIFTIESAMQLLYFGLRGFFRDGFRVFDLLIVILSWAMEGTQVIRAFRIFRASRLITRIETMRNLVLAIFNVMPKMTAIFLLLILIFFIFGVMFTTLFKGMYLDGELTEPFFESLFYSFFTLFQMMTMVSEYCGTELVHIMCCVHCPLSLPSLLSQPLFLHSYIIGLMVNHYETNTRGISNGMDPLCHIHHINRVCSGQFNHRCHLRCSQHTWGS